MASGKKHPKHRQEPDSIEESEQKDSRFITWVSEVNKWNRRPGDKLTKRQRVDVIGALIVFMIIAVCVVGFFVLVFALAVEIGQQPDYNRP